MVRIKSYIASFTICILGMGLSACVEFEPSALDVSEGGIAGLLVSAAENASTADPGTGTTAETTARLVVVGQSGLGAWSDDGTNWTVIDIAGNSNMVLQKVIWTGTRFVVVGYNGSTFVEAVYTSATGKSSWTASIISSPCGGAFTTLDDVVLAGGRLVAVGASDSGAACAHFSTDDGASWSSLNAGASSFPFQKVAYDGSMYLAAATNFAVGVQTFQSNGSGAFSLTAATATGSGGSDPALGDLTQIGSSSTVVWVGTTAGLTSDSSFTTNTGGTWTADASNIFGGAASAPRGVVADMSLSLLVAVGDACRYDTANNLATLNWSSGGATIPACSGVNFRDLIFENGSSTWFAIGQNAGMALWSTTNGSTWNQEAANALLTPNSIASSQ